MQISKKFLTIWNTHFSIHFTHRALRPKFIISIIFERKTYKIFNIWAIWMTKKWNLWKYIPTSSFWGKRTHRLWQNNIISNDFIIGHQITGMDMSYGRGKGSEIFLAFLHHKILLSWMPFWASKISENQSKSKMLPNIRESLKFFKS